MISRLERARAHMNAVCSLVHFYDYSSNPVFSEYAAKEAGQPGSGFSGTPPGSGRKSCTGISSPHARNSGSSARENPFLNRWNPCRKASRSRTRSPLHRLRRSSPGTGLCNFFPRPRVLMEYPVGRPL
jgi:hypothetical protein